MPDSRRPPDGSGERTLTPRRVPAQASVMRCPRAVRWVTGLSVLLPLLLAGCAAAGRGAPGGHDRGALYVVDADAAAIVRVDPRTGRPVGGPLPGGPAPWQAVAGPDDSLLVLSAPAAG